MNPPLTLRTNLISLLACISLFTTTPSTATVIGDCGPPAAAENPLHPPALQIQTQLEASTADAEIKNQFAMRWSELQTEHDTLDSQARGDDEECRQLKALADQTLTQLQTCQTHCNQAATDPDAYTACQACAGPVNAELAQREIEYNHFTAKVQPYNDRVLAWESSLKKFTADASAAIPTGYSGKRYYHMYVKSWINGAAITESSWAARKINMDVNTKPLQAKAGSAFDYKIYQAFGVEVEFKNDKIVRALFTPGSKQNLANTTFGLRGEVRILDEDITLSADKTQVTFQRKMEGNPNMLIKAVDAAAAEAVLHAWGLDLPAINRKIYNLLKITINAEGATPYGEGSAFPTHYFWIREQGTDRQFDTQEQVQPSEYFQ